jgi:hypothetical protein
MRYAETHRRHNIEHPPVTVRWPSPEHAEEMRRFAASLGESVSLFLRRSAAERMERLRESQ